MSACLYAVLCFGLTLQNDESGAPPSDPDAALAADRLCRSLEPVRSLAVRMRCWSESDRAGVRVECAALNQFRMDSLTHLPGEKSEIEAVPAYRTVFNGREVLTYYPDQWRLERCRKFIEPKYLAKIQSSFPFETLGWWPDDDAESPPIDPAGSAFFLHTLRKGTARVFFDDDAPKEEGEQVLAIESEWGIERIWLKDQGPTVRKRERYVGVDGSEVWVEYEFDDYREVSPGVRLPFSMRRYLPRLKMTTFAEVEEYTVNHLTESAFELTAEAGVLVVDRDTDKITQVPGGLTVLEEIVSACDRQYRAAVRPQEWAPLAGSEKSAGLCGILGVFSGVLASVYEQARRRRQAFEENGR